MKHIIRLITASTIILLISFSYHAKSYANELEEINGIQKNYISTQDKALDIYRDKTERLEEDLISKNIEIKQLIDNFTLYAALEPLKPYFSPDEISEIVKEIPHGSPFREDFNVTATFGESVGYHGRFRQDHNGVDLVCSNPLIVPIADGTSVKFIMDLVYGKTLVIEHSERVRSSYSHGEKVYNRGIPGEKVTTEDAIMKMGHTGMVYSPSGGLGDHLHFMIEVRVSNEGIWVPIDPLPFIRG